MGKEIADADGAYGSLPIQVLKYLPGFAYPRRPFRFMPWADRPMDQIEIEIVGTKPPAASFECTQDLVVALVIVPELARDEEASTIDAAFP
jgi:hypothetical protein